jgi:hypothetical protein
MPVLLEGPVVEPSAQVDGARLYLDRQDGRVDPLGE